ncbi:hypothetical protein FOT62_22590 [Serratia marcescens]|uniref:Fels-1 Prophage Protein-like protein n=2 Tax=Serratia TaxID=613 RepID=A0A5C7BRU3_SERMA|nr:YcgJ family protein [Serratia marcescens]TXE27111.1 hypothetical protein FOT62_22590 [Serratia marcescens]TXE55332.1 hypothetical protein FOT56_25575 [Serratia marcescens]
MKRYLIIVLLVVLSPSTFAKPAPALKNPTQGVLCDQYFCANRNGISDSLTLTYLGEKRAKALASQGAFDKSAFTFSNGVFCDVKEKLCHVDRYFSDGKRSPVAEKETRLLFSGGDSQ